MTPSRILGAALLAVLVACSTARDPAKGFRLAGSGDIRRGRDAFLSFQCTECHEVAGVALPLPSRQAVALGGSVIHLPSDGYLVTAIINPAYHATHYPAGRRGLAHAGLHRPYDRARPHRYRG
jgi:hypothetical protein